MVLHLPWAKRGGGGGYDQSSAYNLRLYILRIKFLISFMCINIFKNYNTS